jgi:hypothetical protein
MWNVGGKGHESKKGTIKHVKDEKEEVGQEIKELIKGVTDQSTLYADIKLS